MTIREHHWEPVATPTGRASAAFVRDPSFTRLAIVSVTRQGVTIEAGLEDLALMKTAGSSFAGYPRDRYTTLPETDDRIMATQVSARWLYRSAELDAGVDYDTLFGAVLDTLLDVFAAHDSPSVQASTWIIGRAILERHHELEEISFSLPNLHHLLVDLTPFGLVNDNEIFVATREPHGLIEATVRRS